MPETIRVLRDSFLQSLAEPRPPSAMPKAMQALWFAEKGDLDRALAMGAEPEGAEGAWVQAHLHRASGDLARARYWYSRAARSVPVMPIPQERLAILTALLAGHGKP